MKKSFKTAYDLPRKVKETIPFRDITNENWSAVHADIVPSMHTYELFLKQFFKNN